MYNLPSSVTVFAASMHNGEIKIPGYKHAMVQIIAASISTNMPIIIDYVPLVDDSFILRDIINQSGGKCIINNKMLTCDPTTMKSFYIEEKLSSKIHGAIYLMPAYLNRFGQFNIGQSGGCQIGNSTEGKSRPVNHMLRVMEKFGAKIELLENGRIAGKLSSNKEKDIAIDIAEFSESKENLTGSCISGSTKTALLMLPSKHNLLLQNPYLKTDVRDLVRFYSTLGYNFEISKNTLRATNPCSTNDKRILEFSLTECVSEVMTYFALAIHANIELRLKIKNLNSVQTGLEQELRILKDIGVKFKFGHDYIDILKSETIGSTNIEVTNQTIQSDHLPFFALILLKANGTSILRDFVWPERFAYVAELVKLGANLLHTNNTLIVNNSNLEKYHDSGITLYGYDTRSAAIAIISSLMTRTKVLIKNIEHIHRGYEDLIGKIRTLGAIIVADEKVQ